MPTKHPIVKRTLLAPRWFTSQGVSGQAAVIESTPAEVRTVLPSVEMLVCPSGANILTEGVMGTDVYVVYSGRVRVQHPVLKIFHKTVGDLGPGDIFGEIGFIVPSLRVTSGTDLSSYAGPLKRP